MTAVTYTARRSIIPGHSINSSYSLDLPCVAVDPKRDPRVETQETLSGARESLRYHAVMTYAVTLAPLQGTELRAVLEFLDSVEAGEAFTFDPHGSANDPDAPVTAELESGGYPLNRRPQGKGGGSDPFSVQFTVRVVLP